MCVKNGQIRAPNEEARTAAAQILARTMRNKGKAYVYVNNRLEGNALLTIDGALTFPMNL